MSTPEPIPFTPVLLQRRRRDGWTPERQRQFIDALAQCGAVTAAAKRVGMSARSAYALLERDGAESFAEAWDQAIVMGQDAMRAAVFDRALNGGWVPVSRGGKVIGMRFRYFDALACAVLSGKDRDMDEANHMRRIRRETRREWKAIDERKRVEAAAEAAARAEVLRETEAYFARMEEEKQRLRSLRPRIITL